MPTKKVQTLGLVALFSISLLTSCDIRINGTQKTSASVAFYQGQGEAGNYQAVRAESTSETQASARVAWVPCLSTDVHTCKTQVIDFTITEDHGYGKLILSDLGRGKVLASFSGIVSDTSNNEIRINIPYNYQAEAEFIQGNWQEYIEGKNIQIHFTHAGRKAATQALLDTIKKGLKLGFQQMNQQSSPTDLQMNEPIVKSYTCKGFELFREPLKT